MKDKEKCKYFREIDYGYRQSKQCYAQKCAPEVYCNGNVDKCSKCPTMMEESEQRLKESAKYYKIYGYDSNFDLGGNHIQPLLCIVRARDKAQAEEYANTLPRYKDSWHGEGYIEEVKVVDLVGD